MVSYWIGKLNCILWRFRRAYLISNRLWYQLHWRHRRDSIQRGMACSNMYSARASSNIGRRYHVYATKVRNPLPDQNVSADRSFSPRWLMTKGREEECLSVLASLRRKPPTDEGLQLEFLEVKAQHLFERETSIAKFPNYQDGSFMSNLKLGFHEYASLVTNRSLLKRVIVAVMIMVFQQCKFRVHRSVRSVLTISTGSGINAILYYAAVSRSSSARTFV